MVEFTGASATSSADAVDIDFGTLSMDAGSDLAADTLECDNGDAIINAADTSTLTIDTANVIVNGTLTFNLTSDADVHITTFTDSRIVDINGECIEVYRDPSVTGYRTMHIYVRGDSLSPAFAQDLVIEVDAILGPPAASAD